MILLPMLDKLEYPQREVVIQKLKDESKPTRGCYFMTALAVVIATLG